MISAQTGGRGAIRDHPDGVLRVRTEAILRQPDVVEAVGIEHELAQGTRADIVGIRDDVKVEAEVDVRDRGVDRRHGHPRAGLSVARGAGDELPGIDVDLIAGTGVVGVRFRRLVAADFIRHRQCSPQTAVGAIRRNREMRTRDVPGARRRHRLGDDAYDEVSSRQSAELVSTQTVARGLAEEHAGNTTEQLDARIRADHSARGDQTASGAAAVVEVLEHRSANDRGRVRQSGHQQSHHEEQERRCHANEAGMRQPAHGTGQTRSLEVGVHATRSDGVRLWGEMRSHSVPFEIRHRVVLD